MSKLYFWYGAMNCGKTTHLLQVIHNYESQNMNTILLKSKHDSKGDDYVISRLGIKKKVDVLVNTETNILEMIHGFLAEKGQIHCIMVDEVQFLKASHIDQLLQVAVEYNIPVMCYGLRTDFRMDGFEGSSRLLELAHSIAEIKNICSCGKKATLNGRKINGKFVFDGAQVVIDNQAEVEYEALCPKCFFALKKASH
ncbi:MAG TPA: thymidine kinase [Epulopiscium sp.]|nr:thymidine kinase [Candidatus Epulonipiscium sp.]